MRLHWISTFGLACLVAVGCGADTEEATGTGMARVRVNIAQLTAYEITEVTIEASGVVETLVRDSDTGVFNGALLLPVGAHDLVARAYQDATLVGESTPTPVDIQAGVVTEVSLRILDTTGGSQPDYGPIVASLTYPATTEAGAAASLAVSVVDPDGDPVTISWSDDCADSTFTAPDAATTEWSKDTEGTCNITVTATAGGLSASETFAVVVFAAGASSGAVSVDGTFIEAPMISVRLTYDSRDCDVTPSSASASCSTPIASPEYASVSGLVSWGNGTPGTIEVVDTCGGAFGFGFRSSFDFHGTWLPPVEAGVCFVTVQATNGEGGVGNLSAAVLVGEGTPRVVSPPNIMMAVQAPDGTCLVDSSASPVDCGQALSGQNLFLDIQTDWLDGLAGSVEVTDDCGGTVELSSESNSGFINGVWTPPATSGVTCNLTVDATSLEGASSQAVGLFELL